MRRRSLRAIRNANPIGSNFDGNRALQQCDVHNQPLAILGTHYAALNAAERPACDQHPLTRCQSAPRFHLQACGYDALNRLQFIHRNGNWPAIVANNAKHTGHGHDSCAHIAIQAAENVPWKECPVQDFHTVGPAMELVVRRQEHFVTARPQMAGGRMFPPGSHMHSEPFRIGLRSYAAAAKVPSSDRGHRPEIKKNSVDNNAFSACLSSLFWTENSLDAFSKK
jgi:hypothetical protein